MMEYYTSFFRRGNRVYIRKILEDGSRENLKLDYKPKLYMIGTDESAQYRTLDGEPLTEIEFESIKSAREYADVSNKRMFGYNRWEYSAVNEVFPEKIKYDFNNLRIVYLDIETGSEGGYSSVANPYQPIILIQMLYQGKIYVLGTKHYESYDDNLVYVRCKDEEDLLKKFVKLFRKINPDIISGWNSQGYDIPMLHNRMERLEMLDVFNQLSPFNMVDTKEQVVFGKAQLRVDIKGVQHLDMLELIIKFDNKKYENKKLDTVAKAILKRGKVAYKGNLNDLYVTDFEKFVEYGKVDVQLVNDIEGVKNLIRMVVGVAYMDKTNYIDAFSQVRMWDNQIMTKLKNEYNIQVPFKIAKEEDGFVEDDDEKFEGAFVYEPIPNKYKWVTSTDVRSMHPSIIMAFNISPETYVGNANKNVDFFLNDSQELVKFSQQIKDRQVTTLANGAMFDATYEGILPKIVREVFNMRVEAKNKAKEHAIKVVELKKRIAGGESGLEEEVSYNQDREVEYNTLQNALKVKINSMFGFLGNKFSRFYQLDMAEGITLTSQVMLKTGAKLINQVVSKYTKTEKDYLIYGDTDSLYFSMEDVVNKYVPAGTSVETTIEFMDRFYNSKIKQELENAMSNIQELMNSRVKEIEFVRDVISDTSIFIAKKRYIISVWDAEGKRYTEPDLKVMGVESVKTSTPQYCRDKIKELISAMLYQTETEFQNKVVDIKDEFFKLPVEDVAFPRGVSDIDKYVEIKENISIFNNDDDEIAVKKGASIAAKASIHHNKLLIEKDLLNWYQPITNGDKIKFVYLVQPNPIKNNAIAFDGELIQEFGLHKYVDYDTQWEKALYEPVKKIATIIGWDMEKSYALF